MNRAVIGTSEIVLSVNELPTMRDFYVEVLGFPIQSELCLTDEDQSNPNGEPTISFLKIAEIDTPLGRDKHPQLLALIDWKRHVFAKSRFDGHNVRQSTLNHLAFEILPESHDREFDRLAKLGLNPVKSSFPDLNAKAIFFKDPEGNLLELICHDPKR